MIKIKIKITIGLQFSPKAFSRLSEQSDDDDQGFLPQRGRGHDFGIVRVLRPNYLFVVSLEVV